MVLVALCRDLAIVTGVIRDTLFSLGFIIKLKIQIAKVTCKSVSNKMKQVGIITVLQIDYWDNMIQLIVIISYSVEWKYSEKMLDGMTA